MNLVYIWYIRCKKGWQHWYQGLATLVSISYHSWQVDKRGLTCGTVTVLSLLGILSLDWNF